jgi:8-oxo-dGTP diphosphatase
VPNATVAAIIITRQAGVEQILLTRRNVEPFKGMWCLPGGHIDQYETAKDAVVREVKEETDIDLNPSFFGYFDEILPHQGLHAVVLTFVGNYTGRVDPNKDEVIEIGWFSMPEALSLPLAFAHKSIVEAYAGKPT